MPEGQSFRLSSLSDKLLAVSAVERRALLWSFLYFFSVLCSYYILRPVREEMAILSGTQTIPWLFLATFTVMLIAVPIFGWITSRYSRARFLPWVYLFFAINLLMLYAAFRVISDGAPWVARAFFVWLSVFNLFVVSVFWSFMADLYTSEQARRLFGMIAAGGSAGALTGPAITAILVPRIGHQSLLLLSVVLLLFAIVCIYQLGKWSQTQPDHTLTSAEQPMGGGLFEAIPLLLKSSYLLAISAVMVLANFTGVVVYIFQAQIVEASFDVSSTRTAVFAGMDLAVNVVAFVFQVGLARYAIQKLGPGLTLVLLPAFSIVGFAVLALHPALGVLVAFQVMRRGMNYGLSQPAKQLLYTVVPVNAKYKAKNFIDTVVYRGGDAISAQIMRLFQLAGASLGLIATVCTAACAVWIGISLFLGRVYAARYRQKDAVPDGAAAAQAEA